MKALPAPDGCVLKVTAVLLVLEAIDSNQHS